MTEEQWPDALWYVARGAGVVALVLLTVAIVLGIVARSGRPAAGLPRFAVTLVHRNTSLLAVVLLAVHAVILRLDPYAHLATLDLVVPFRADDGSAWLAFGTVASDLVVAVVVTSLLRHRIGRRGWRAVHWLAYAAWPVALLHGLGTGSDAGQLWVRGTAAGCAVAVVAAVAWRCVGGFPETATARRSGDPR
jgi:methionine sulfoxide reductase heme-binding subunit